MKQFQGKVISTKMEKTAVVEVSRRVRHPLYQKVYTKKKKYHVHDEVGVKKGDEVVFVETRPISKTKRWKIVDIINSKHQAPNSKQYSMTKIQNPK